MNYRLHLLALLFFSIFSSLSHAAPLEIKKNLPALSQEVRVPILLYHRFGPTVADGMTITTPVFESHLKYLRDNGYKVIPLRQLVDWYQKKGPAPAPKSVVIVEDDAHKSVYTDMLPLAKKYNVPVTVFIYPSAISNAKYAMTWDQIRELKRSGLFDFQGHTYWHPNFKRDKKKMTPQDRKRAGGKSGHAGMAVRYLRRLSTEESGRSRLYFHFHNRGPSCRSH